MAVILVLTNSQGKYLFLYTIVLVSPKGNVNTFGDISFAVIALSSLNALPLVNEVKCIAF